MKHVIRNYFIGSAVILCAAAGFATGVMSTVYRGLGTDIGFVPGTCWDSSILVVNHAGQFIDRLIIREGEDVLWQGRVAFPFGGCIPKRSTEFRVTVVEATFEDGTQLMHVIEEGTARSSVSSVHLLLIEPTEIRHIIYLGTQNSPLAAMGNAVPAPA